MSIEKFLTWWNIDFNKFLGLFFVLKFLKVVDYFEKYFKIKN